ncbi:hypothetical protein ACQEVB_40845 [Pseudonocardia sp. CA-107938]|uniref:hypothetical protein n=1 Tax=Pseudonocardia sp. CA-107938 TaxID=3240021 RepID=UPI003D8ACEFD
MFETSELSICVVCLHLFANGEYVDGTDIAETTAAAIEDLWGDQARHICAEGTELGFCSTACETCGNADHGDRYCAVALVPIAS